MVKKLLGMRRLICVLMVMTMVSTLRAQSPVSCQTFGYATHDNTELYLDVYRTAPAQGEELRPCVVFMFGGGFVGGTRDNDIYMSYFEGLARAGMVVVSIDYRLGLANINGSEDINVRAMVGAMDNAVHIAVEDLYSATNYVLAHAAEWGVDSSKIVISGSSAGAIASLQAEWLMCNGDARCKVLPEDFRYAGVVACAGAIFSTSGRPKFKGSAAPMLLFHGTSDSNVPYDRASLLGVGFYGSEYIVTQLDKQSSPYYFCSVKYADHSLAVEPLQESVNLIVHFIEEYVVRGKSMRTISEVVKIGGAKAPTRFSVMDYMKSNYAPR